MATLNMNPDFLNFEPGTVPAHPQAMPEYNYFIDASVTSPRNSSSTEQQNTASAETTEADYRYLEDIAQSGASRESSQSETVSPEFPEKRDPSLDLGEVRAFSNVCRTSLPPLPRNENGEVRDNIPAVTVWQRGRLAAIGERSYVFLSTEINNGFPDGQRFTQEKLNRYARTFDETIFPTTVNEFVPQQFQGDFQFQEENVFYPPDLGVDQLQFNDDGEITNANPQQLTRQDNEIQNDNRFIIFIYNSKPNVPPRGAAAFFVPDDQQLPPRACGVVTEQDDEAEEYQPPTQSQFTGITSYITDGANLFPPNSGNLNDAESTLAHEFQHVLHHQYQVSGTPGDRWFNEGMSNLNMWLNGYTISSGSSDILLGQINQWLAQPDVVPSVGDESGRASGSEFAAYGARFALMEYIYEHYQGNPVREMYGNAQVNSALRGNSIRNIEEATGEEFSSTFEKFALSVALDVMTVQEDGPIANFTDASGAPWLQFSRVDLDGSFGTSPTGLNGPRIDVLPETPQLYPLNGKRRTVKPWTMDYVVLTNGQGGELELTVTSSSPNTVHFLLPLEETTDPDSNEQVFRVTDEVQIQAN